MVKENPLKINKMLPTEYRLEMIGANYLLHVDPTDSKGLLAGAESPCYRKTMAILEDSGIRPEICTDCLADF